MKENKMAESSLIEMEDFGFNHYIHHFEDCECLEYNDEFECIEVMADLMEEIIWEWEFSQRAVYEKGNRRRERFFFIDFNLIYFFTIPHIFIFSRLDDIMNWYTNNIRF